jgi:iron complex outermembrane receptor protein
MKRSAGGILKIVVAAVWIASSAIPVAQILWAAEERAAVSDEIESEEVTVMGKRETGYVVTHVPTSTATKSDTPVFKTPYNVNIVPQAVLRAQQAYRLEDALKNISGVRTSFNPLLGVNFNIRGFDTNNIIYRDGFRQFQPQIDMANVERVEVLKGAAGSLYGRIEPGGLVNLVIKKPLPDAQYSIEQQFGSFQFFRTVADATGPLTKNGSLLYRAIFSFQDNNSFRDQVESRHLMFTPSLTWNITSQTQWYGNFEYKDFDDVGDNGIPAVGNRPASVPLSRFFGIVNRPLTNIKHYTIDTHLVHTFNSDWSLKVRGAWWKYNMLLFDSGPAALQPDGRTLDIYVAAPYREQSETYFGEATLTGRFQTWGVQHNMVAGLEYYNRHSNQRFFFDSSDSGSGLLLPINLFNPRYQTFASLGTLIPNQVFRPKDRWASAYVQDQITLFDRLHVMLSARFDHTEASSVSCVLESDAGCPDSPKLRRSFNRFTPRFGVNYEVLPWLALFGSYSEGFGDTNFFNGLLLSGSAPRPETAQQGEIGLKAKGFQERLLATVTLYHLVKDNVTVPVPGQVNLVNQVGQFRNRGIEVDVVGQVTDEVNLIASYSYIDSAVTKDVDDAGGLGNQGNRLFNVPRHSGSFWANYDFQEGRLKGLGFGSGIFAASQQEGSADNTFQLPGYVRLDSSITYGWELGTHRLTAQLNVLNLLDQPFFEGTNGTAFAIVPGERRMFLGMLRWAY